MDTMTTDKKLRTTRTVAPEDLRGGQYIAITRMMIQLIPPMCDPQLTPEPQTVRLWGIPPFAGQPMRIVSVCLPFVLVEGVDRQCRTLDLRRMEVVRLPKKYGRAAFERLAKPAAGGPAGEAAAAPRA